MSRAVQLSRQWYHEIFLAQNRSLQIYIILIYQEEPRVSISFLTGCQCIFLSAVSNIYIDFESRCSCLSDVGYYASVQIASTLKVPAQTVANVVKITGASMKKVFEAL